MEDNFNILTAEVRQFMRESEERKSTGVQKMDDADCESLLKRIAQSLLSGFLSHISSNPALKPGIEGRSPA